MILESLEQDLLANYERIESWKADHDAAMHCRDVERWIEQGNFAFDAFSRYAAGLPAAGVYLKNEAIQQHCDQVTGLFEGWLRISSIVIGAARKCVADGFEVKDLEAFEATFEECQALVDGLTIGKELAPVVETTHLLRGNPDPARYGD